MLEFLRKVFRPRTGIIFVRGMSNEPTSFPTEFAESLSRIYSEPDLDLLAMQNIRKHRLDVLWDKNGVRVRNGQAAEVYLEDPAEAVLKYADQLPKPRPSGGQ